MKALVIIAVALLFPVHPATQTWEELSTQTAMAAMQTAPVASGGYMVSGAFAVHPHAGAPALLLGALWAGPAQVGVPCIGCVKGAGSTNNVGLSGPEGYVFTKATWEYALTVSNVTYKGHCKMTWAIAAGSKVIDRFASPEFSFTKPDDYYFVYGYPRSRPNYSGPAVITGGVTCNGTPPLSTKMDLYFE